MKKIISILLALTMVFGLFAGTQMTISAKETTAIVVTAEDDTTDPAIDDTEIETPEDVPSDVPTLPTESEFSEWISGIISSVLAILAKICEVIFDNILW